MRARGAHLCALAAVAAVAAGLTLPALGSHGLWEPDERRAADTAAAGARFEPGPGVRAALAGVGMSALGRTEAAARLPSALGALACLGLVVWAGWRLHGAGEGLAAGWALLGAPAFVLGARQLTSEIPGMCAFTLAIAGLGGFVVGGGRGRWLHLAAGAVGLALVTMTTGLVCSLGILLAAVLALALNPQALIPAPWPAGPRRALLAVGAGSAGALVLSLSLPHTARELSWRLGGVLTGAARPPSFEALLRAFGFGLFPLGALAFFSLWQPALEDAAGDATGTTASEHRRFAGHLLLLAAGFGLALGTLRTQLTAETSLFFLPAAALAIGRAVITASRGESPNLLLGLLAAGGAMVVARDLTQTPAELVSIYLGSKPVWPPQLDPRGPLLATGATAALAILLLFAGTGRARRLAPMGLLAAAVASTLWLAHGLLPALSRHLSPRALLDTYERLRSPAAELLVHASSARTGPPGAPTPPPVTSLSELATAFSRRADAFAIVPRTELGRIDQLLGERGIAYAVADASSSRLLLLARRLPAGQPDASPLAPLRWRPPAGTPPGARPPWPAPRVPIAATFGGALDLHGADFPPVVRRRDGFPLTLHFRVHGAPPPDHHVFVHLEKPGTLINGDHPPLGGLFPTTLWRPGDELRDQHHVSLPSVLTPAGRYRIHVGLWPGGNTDRRLPVTAGPQDGRDRVPVGEVEVR